jgi:tRNA(fMet)-specific endonuclease VapC
MRGEPGVAEALARLARSDVLIPQPAVAEIEYGLSRLPSSKRKTRLQKRWDVLRGEIHRAPWSDDTSEAFGRMKAELERIGLRLEDFDLAIAAHAVALEATLVTDDLAHFGRIRGLRVVSWRHRDG